MYDTLSKHYVFRQSSDVLWNFFHDARQGICYSTMTKRTIWTNPVSLHKNAQKSFFIDMDADDRFHILFQDNQGNVNYSLLDKDSIKTVSVLNSKTPVIYDKHLYAVPMKNNIHIFYILQHENSSILAYQILGEGKLSNPKVIDYVTDSRCPCSIICDKTPNIYTFYQSSDGKSLQLGYKKYNVLQKTWSEFIPITKYSSGDCEYPKTIIDNNGILHLCYQRRNNKQFELVYQQKIPDKNLWTEEVIIHTSSFSFDNTSIISHNGSIIVYWVRDDIIYYNIGGQSGSKWGKPSRYNYPINKQLMCLTYKTNNIYESEKIAARDIPGNYIGGLKFAFYQPSSDSGENLSVEELKNLILDSLKLLKGSVEELQESHLKLRDEINKLNNGNLEFEKELVKYTVKLDSLETQLNQSKSYASRLDNMENKLADVKSRLDNKIIIEYEKTPREKVGRKKNIEKLESRPIQLLSAVSEEKKNYEEDE